MVSEIYNDIIRGMANIHEEEFGDDAQRIREVKDRIVANVFELKDEEWLEENDPHKSGLIFDPSY